MPRANVLGDPGQGYKVAIETLNEGRIGIGAQMVGLSQGALDHALAYVQERKQFGQAIGEFQAVQFQLAQAATELEMARVGVYNAARLRDAGRPFLTEAAMAKLFSSAGGRAGHVTRRSALWRRGVYKGFSGREALPRREDRTDLRRDIEHAIADDREADPARQMRT